MPASAARSSMRGGRRSGAAVAGAGLDGLPQLLGDSWMSLSAVMVMATNGANSNNRPKVGNKL
jgi:hypothetical protein